MAAKSSLFTYNEETIVRPISPSILTILLLNLQTSKTDTKSVKLNFGPGQNICFALKDKKIGYRPKMGKIDQSATTSFSYKVDQVW